MVSLTCIFFICSCILCTDMVTSTSGSIKDVGGGGIRGEDVMRRDGDGLSILLIRR